MSPYKSPWSSLPEPDPRAVLVILGILPPFSELARSLDARVPNRNPGGSPLKIQAELPLKNSGDFGERINPRFFCREAIKIAPLLFARGGSWAVLAHYAWTDRSRFPFMKPSSRKNAFNFWLKIGFWLATGTWTVTQSMGSLQSRAQSGHGIVQAIDSYPVRVSRRI